MGSLGFTSLLAQVTKDKDLAEKAKKVSSRPAGSSVSSGSNSTPVSARNPPANRATRVPARPVAKKPVKALRQFDGPSDDPAVRRLKEARRRERERLALHKKTAKKRAPKPRSTAPSADVSKQRTLAVRRAPSIVRPPIVRPKPVAASGPKLSFKQLMEKADTIDSNTLQFNPVKLIREQPKETAGLKKSSIMRGNDFSRPRGHSPASDTFIHARKRRPPPPSRPGGPTYAQPSKELQEKLARRRMANHRRRRRGPPSRNNATFDDDKPKDTYGIEANSDDDESDGYGYDDYSDYDDDDDGFVVDDEEDSEVADHKQEVLDMFRRSGKRPQNYRDDDSDDMEATGAELLEEEEEALRQAKIDDRREARLLEQHRLEKLKRKQHQ